jgi:hypothetical protein
MLQPAGADPTTPDSTGPGFASTWVSTESTHPMEHIDKKLQYIRLGSTGKSFRWLIVLHVLCRRKFQAERTPIKLCCSILPSTDVNPLASVTCLPPVVLQLIQQVQGKESLHHVFTRLLLVTHCQNFFTLAAVRGRPRSGCYFFLQVLDKFPIKAIST